MFKMIAIPREFKSYSKNCTRLNKTLKNTRLALNDINHNFHLEKELGQEFLNQDVLKDLEKNLLRIPTLLIFGQNCTCKAHFVNTVLEQQILPYFGDQWRSVAFMYGEERNIRLILENEYEILDKLKAHEGSWVSIPEQDITRNKCECPVNHCPSLEVELRNPVLKNNVRILVPLDCDPSRLRKMLLKQAENILPVIVYTVSEDVLSDENIQEIKTIKDIYKVPILFVCVPNLIKYELINTESLTESDQQGFENEAVHAMDSKLVNIRNQLLRLGYLIDTKTSNVEDIMNSSSLCFECSSDFFMPFSRLNEDLVVFIRNILKLTVLKLGFNLSEIHNKYLRRFILCAFDMAREIQITPRKILYSQEIELKLFETLTKISNDQQEEITAIIQKTLQDMKSNAAEVIENWNFDIQQSSKITTMEIQQMVLSKLSNSVANEIVKSVSCLQESFTGTLQRCLESLERNRQESEDNLSASDAVKQIITAAYNIDLRCCTSVSVMENFLKRVRNYLTNLMLPWTQTTPNQFDLQWQLHVVTNMIESLNASKLARTISLQFQESVKFSHESFKSAMRSLENQLSSQLEQTEEQRITIRKKHAPRFARLALESASFCDLLRWGMPKQIREIGRGQYGVVSSCEPWCGIEPCAFKSVVPPDDRHWNDLAMEFYYTRNLPEHPRIVKLRGSVIDYSYGGGSAAAVLLIMERMNRDLYCGLKSGLLWLTRLRIAIDVVEGIRYLHSQGLVHRDIKLKNVLLTSDNRAKLTDFGFCIPEAMMSGSVVGTPVHMAPELLSGRYDSSVDVYAFGILFWYICAGQVNLPHHFTQFQNKEQLWSSVRKGMRPECLEKFEDCCWKLMEKCWAAEPSERPLLGYVQPQLEKIYNEAAMHIAEKKQDIKNDYVPEQSDDDFSSCLRQV